MRYHPGWAWSRTLCRVLHLHTTGCRGRADHWGTNERDGGLWLPPLNLYSSLVYPWWARLGILLKLTGCRMIHGPGHYFAGPQPRRSEGVLTCHSCGHYIDVPIPPPSPTTTECGTKWRRASVTGDCPANLYEDRGSCVCSLLWQAEGPHPGDHVCVYCGEAMPQGVKPSW